MVELLSGFCFLAAVIVGTWESCAAHEKVIRESEDA
jgi:hypothetical protein